MEIVEEIRDKKGNVVDVKFNPTFKMRAFAQAITCDDRFKAKEPEWVLRQIGLNPKILKLWRQEFNPYFDEWIAEVFAVFGGGISKKAMLEFVGMEMAVKEKDFQFWKPLAIREGVIEKEEIGVLIPANLGAYGDWSAEQVEQHRNSLLASLRAVDGEAIAPPPAVEVATKDDSPDASEVVLRVSGGDDVFDL